MKNFVQKNRRSLWVLAAVIVLAVILRTYNLNSVPVFVDEAIYVRWAQVMRAESTLRFLPQSDGKQPLFMWSVIPFFKLFEDPLVAGRIVSALSGVGSLLGMFVLSYLLFSSFAVAVATALIYAVSPFSVFFDRLALADSMLTFFGIWTFIFGLVTAKNKRLDMGMITGFFLGGALLTKSPGVYFAVLLPLTAVVYLKKFRIKEIFHRLVFFIPTYVISYAMYNVLRLGPNFHMIAIRNKDYVYPLSHILTSPLDPLKPFISRVFEYFWILGPTFLVVMVLQGTYYGYRKFLKETLFIVLVGLFPVLVSSELARTMTARYVYFSVPYFFILAALVFPGISKIKTKKFSSAMFIAPALFLLHALFTDFILVTNPQAVNLPRSERSGYLEDWTSGYGIKEVSVYIRNHQKENPSEKIVVGTEGFFGTLPDGLQMYLNDLPQITVIGVGLSIENVPVSLVESKKAGNKTYLLINRSRLFGVPEKMGFSVVVGYPKAVKPDGTRDELLLLEVTDRD